MWRLKELAELCDGQAGIAKDRPQGPRLEGVMVGDGHGATFRVRRMPQADVASALADDQVSDLLQRADGLSTRDDRQAGHTSTRTSVSSEGEVAGIGSPSSARSSRTSKMASRMLDSDSSSVSPWL